MLCVILIDGSMDWFPNSFKFQLMKLQLLLVLCSQVSVLLITVIIFYTMNNLCKVRILAVKVL